MSPQVGLIGCTLIAEAFGLWSFRLYESWVIYKNLNMCDHHFRFLEFQKFKTSWVIFNHSRWRNAMVDEASAGLMQQSGQDLESWKCFSYISCARGGKSWLCCTCPARRVEEDILLEVNRFEGGRHVERRTISPASCFLQPPRNAVDYTHLHLVVQYFLLHHT